MAYREDIIKKLIFWFRKTFKKNDLNCRSFCGTCPYFERCRDEEESGDVETDYVQTENTFN